MQENNKEKVAIEKKVLFAYEEISNFFEEKKEIILEYKHIPIEEILEHAPKYYSLIGMLDKLYSLISNDNDWLIEFVNSHNIKFDWQKYRRWKSGKESTRYLFSDTKAPSKWVHILQDYFIDILNTLQTLLAFELYINENEFKEFLSKNPTINYKYKANYIKSSLPSDNLQVLYSIIDYILEVNIEYDFRINTVIDTVVCMRVYKKIEDLEILEILKKKEFYFKYRLQFLKMVDKSKRSVIPNERKVINTCDKFFRTAEDLRFSYNEYKKRLIEKFNKVKNKIKF